MLARTLIAFLLLVASPDEERGSRVLGSFHGENAHERFGASVSEAGDVNGDGFADVVVGAPGAGPEDEPTGMVRVYLGHKQTLHLELVGKNPGDRFGHSVSNAGDVNNDGFQDIVVGAPGFDEERGAVTVYSGKDGEILVDIEGDDPGDLFGHSVSSAGDTNNDGFADIIVGAPGVDDKKMGDDAGRAQIYSGKKAKLLHTFKPLTKNERLGWSVAVAGDINSDGFSDVIVGAPDGSEKKKKPVTGVARVYHGKKGKLLHTFVGKEQGDRFGHSVHGAGDVNADSFADLVIGTNCDKGYVVVMDGKKGKELYRFDTDHEGDRFGWSVSSAGDVDGDTFADVIIGIPGPEAAADGEMEAPAPPSTRVYSGKRGDLLFSVDGGSRSNFGCSVSGAGDLTSDSFFEVIVGADHFGRKPGTALVLSMEK